MVIKTCKICGKEFSPKVHNQKCCSPECSKINKYNNDKKYQRSEKGKAAKKRANKKYINSDNGKSKRKEWYENHRDEIREYNKEYRKSNKYKEYQKDWRSDKGKEYMKKYRENHRDELNKYQKEYIQNKIAELNEKFDGDLELILKDCPYSWMVREAIMQVEFGVSYAEAMYQKEKISPVCEVTGRKDNLVIHHLDSFNAHPEKGADLDNLVRITKEIHDEFHSIYGYGNNTREQWFEFLEKNRNIYI